ncbi:MAG: hypothetical protein CMM23_15675 [Rhodospirillaceae bacterium]|nr:hypothetical protein [Rhodospirillaceae bacterium]
MFRFDMSTIEWTHFQGSPRFDYHIDYAIAVLGAQPDIGVIDLLVKWAPNAYCHYHRHLAATTTLVLGGEQNLYETTNTGETIHKVRKAGDYALSPGGDLHMEQAGPDGALIFFGFVSADGRLFETLDKDHNTLATATVQEWAAGNIDGGRRTSIG